MDDSLIRSFRVLPRDEPGAIDEDNVTEGSLLTLFKLLLVASRLLLTRLLKGISFWVVLDLIKILSKFFSFTRKSSSAFAITLYVIPSYE